MWWDRERTLVSLGRGQCPLNLNWGLRPLGLGRCLTPFGTKPEVSRLVTSSTVSKPEARLKVIYKTYISMSANEAPSPRFPNNSLRLEFPNQKLGFVTNRRTSLSFQGVAAPNAQVHLLIRKGRRELVSALIYQVTIQPNPRVYIIPTCFTYTWRTVVGVVYAVEISLAIASTKAWPKWK